MADLNVAYIGATDIEDGELTSPADFVSVNRTLIRADDLEVVEHVETAKLRVFISDQLLECIYQITTGRVQSSSL